MGAADAITVHFVRDHERFAQFWNNHTFGGEQIINPGNLREMDTAEMIIGGHHAKEIEFLKKYRDTLRVYNDQAILMILGIESQEDINYAMPLRQMVYDAMRYEEQRASLERVHRKVHDLSGSELLSGISKADRLMPVLTMVIYWGDKPWDGPKTLRDMLDIPPILNQYKIINDYRMNLLEVNSMENLELYHGELKALLGFVRYQKDKAALRNFIEENTETFSKLSLETARAITVLGNARELQKILKDRKEDGEENINMCQALQDMIMEGRVEEMIENCQEFGVTRKDTYDRLLKKFALTQEQAAEQMQRYWPE